MKENVSIMRFLKDYIENCVSLCGLYHAPFNPRMALFLISNQSSPSKCSFHFQHSCLHSIAQVKNLAMILSSLFLSPPTSSPLATLANSTFEKNLESAPAAILPLSFTWSTELASSLTCFHFPLPSAVSPLQSDWSFEKANQVMSQSSVSTNHGQLAATYLSSLELGPLLLIHCAQSLLLVLEQNKVHSHPKASQLLSPCLLPDPSGSFSRSRLKCPFLRVAHWSHYQNSRHHSIPLSCAYSLHRTYHQLCIFFLSGCCCLSARQTVQQSCAFSFAAALTELRVMPGIW